MNRLLQKVIFFFSILLLTATASYSSFTLQKEGFSNTQTYRSRSEITRQPACVLSTLNFQLNISGPETPEQLKKAKASALKVFLQFRGTISSIVKPEQEKIGNLRPTPLYVSHRQLRL